ncbi:MAG: MBL fold metallo-hydrolase [bacterium]|nr:MAG: MBL fold metallo-hydrolase [bacterium]
MKLGSYQLHTIETGRFRLDGGAFFGTIPKTLWHQRIPSDNENRIELALRCLLIKGKRKNILVDCGIGYKMDDKVKTLLAIDHSMYNLEASLQSVGLDRSDITHVILTHFHYDHAGGATDYDHQGNLVPTFPNALYYIQRKNLMWALNPSDSDHQSYLKENILPLRAHNCLRIVSGKVELFPDIELIPSGGHTVGLQMVKISDKKTTLIYCADVIPTTAHILPHWVMAYDLHPLTSIEEKKNLLAKACKHQWVLFLEHDPDIEACRIRLTEKGYELNERVSL